MVTAFGKELRKIRLEKNLRLKDMADTLEIKSSYLSSIENGKRDISEKLLSNIKQSFSLNPDEIASLDDAYAKTKQNISIDISNMSEEKIDSSLAFARKLGGLSDKQILEIQKILFTEE